MTELEPYQKCAKVNFTEDCEDNCLMFKDCKEFLSQITRKGENDE